MKHLITDIQRFSLNDGPGIRTTVFFKGCNMFCTWCHNPETLSFQPDLMFYSGKCIGCGKCFSLCPNGAHVIINGTHRILQEKCTQCGKCAEACYAQALVISGKEMTVSEIMGEILQDKAYYESSGGGVTLSGGEVLCHADFAAELAKACRQEGISVALETNLSIPWDRICPLLENVDLLMADLKLFDDGEHRKHTGLSNKTTLKNLQTVTHIPLILRTPLIPGVTATRENLRAIGEFAAALPNLLRYELLNFNPLGASKYEGLSSGYAFGSARPYTPGELSQFREMLSDIPVSLKVGE